MFDMTYEQALDKAKHLIAIGETTVYLREGNFPWAAASNVEVSGSYRLNGPCGMCVIAEVAGLTFKWNVDFERREANGKSYALFDRERLREVAMKLPEQARNEFSSLMRKSVMPELHKRTEELRKYLNEQLDSEDCVRGLIAFAEASEKTAA